LFRNDGSSTLSINIFDGYGSVVALRKTYGAVTIIQNQWKVEAVTTNGIEIIANQTFDSDTGWWALKAGTTIGSGVCTITSGGDADYMKLMKTGIATIGKKYKLVFDAKQVSGTGRFTAGNGYTKVLDRKITVGTFDTYECVFTSAGLDRINFGGNVSGDVFELDNVSMQEVI